MGLCTGPPVAGGRCSNLEGVIELSDRASRTKPVCGTCGVEGHVEGCEQETGSVESVRRFMTGEVSDVWMVHEGPWQNVDSVSIERWQL